MQHDNARQRGFGAARIAIGQHSAEPEIRVEMNAPAPRRSAVVAALVAAHPYEEPAYDVVDVAANAGFIGRHGSIAAVTLADLAERITAALGGVTRVAGEWDGEITRVAVVPGSGSAFIGEAAGLADVLVTGDVAHHRAQEALSRGLAVIDPGHVPTERPGVEKLYAAVSAVAPTRDLRHLDPSPWKEA